MDSSGNMDPSGLGGSSGTLGGSSGTLGGGSGGTLGAGGMGAPGAAGAGGAGGTMLARRQAVSGARSVTGTVGAVAMPLLLLAAALML